MQSESMVQTTGAVAFSNPVLTDAPNPNAIGTDRTAFIKFAATGLNGYSFSRGFTITGQGTRTSVSGTTVTVTTYTPLVSGNTFVSGTGAIAKSSPAGTVSDTYGTLGWNVPAPGVYTVPSQIPFFYNYVNTTGGGSTTVVFDVDSGTLTVDAVETNGSGQVTAVAGRMDCIMSGNADGGRKSIHLIGSFLMKP